MVAAKKKKFYEFLQENRPKFQSIGCGLHDDVFYFGTKLFKEGRAYDAVITSDKQIYINDLRKTYDGKKSEWNGSNEIKTTFGLRYKCGFYHEAIDHIMSKEAIDKFLLRNTNNITVKKVFEQLVELLKQYIYFDSETKYKVVALYRIAGFFMPIWETRARLFAHADFGSAKSRLCNILHNTGFNSISLGDWTAAFLQRIIESSSGEIHIDDFESLDEEKQKATIRQIKVGYMKGFKAGKIKENGKVPEVFNLFNTTTINNVEGLDFITADRCITIRIPKISSKDFDKDPDFTNPIYKEIRDSLYIIGLRDAPRVKETYLKIKSDKLNGRLFSIIKPELTMASIISKDLFNEIESWWAEEIEQRDFKEVIDDWEFRGYYMIYKLVVEQNKEDEFFILYDDIIKPLIDDLYNSEYTKFKFKMSAAIGGALSRNPNFKKRVVNGRTQYKIKKEKLLESLKAKRFLDYIMSYDDGSILNITEEKIEDDSTTSIASTTSTTSTPSTKEKNNNKNNNKILVECVEAVETHSATHKHLSSGDAIHLKCNICQETPCYAYDKTGKPLCRGCAKTLQKNGEIVEVLQ